MRGYEKPYYTNVNYPYLVELPYVPNDNPVGVYRKLVSVSKEQAERENYIVFEGAAPCAELFVKGEYVGFSTVSHCTSEFKINLCALPAKWTQNSYKKWNESQSFLSLRKITAFIPRFT